MFDASVGGRPDKPLVLMLHGFGVSRHFWSHQVEALAGEALQRLADGLYAQSGSGSAAVQVLTLHGAKGLEWDRVRIHNDFKPSKDGTISKAEAMLAYVAVTRAKLALDAAALDFISTILGVS